MNRPIIFVTGPRSGGLTAWIFTALNVYLAGGKPVRITADTNVSQDFDGIIIGGGSDISPFHYQNSPESENYKLSTRKKLKLLRYPLELFNYFFGSENKYDPIRDQLEKDLIEKAISKKLPILGICRGHQLINTTLGGNLYQSTLDFYQDKNRIRTLLPRKKTFIESNSKLAKILGKKTKVNALHDQAVKRVAPHLIPVAVEKSGIIQALESQVYPKLLTVQWHPEYLIYKKKQRAIFDWLIKGAIQHG